MLLSFRKKSQWDKANMTSINSSKYHSSAYRWNSFLTYDCLPISIPETIQVVSVCRINSVLHHTCQLSFTSPREVTLSHRAHRSCTHTTCKQQSQLSSSGILKLRTEWMRTLKWCWIDYSISKLKMLIFKEHLFLMALSDSAENIMLW